LNNDMQEEGLRGVLAGRLNKAARARRELAAAFPRVPDGQLPDLQTQDMTVAARTVGGQARQPESTPANKK
jgi:hypothetical protein